MDTKTSGRPKTDSVPQRKHMIRYLLEHESGTNRQLAEAAGLSIAQANRLLNGYDEFQRGNGHPIPWRLDRRRAIVQEVIEA